MDEPEFLKDTLQAIQRAQAAALTEGIKIGRRESAAKIAELERALTESLEALAGLYGLLQLLDHGQAIRGWPDNHRAMTARALLFDKDAALSASRAGGQGDDRG